MHFEEYYTTGLNFFTTGKARSLALFAVFFLLSFFAAAQQTFYPGNLTKALTPVLSLHTKWFDEEGNAYTVPFNDFEHKNLDLHYNFDLPGAEKLPDTVYVYFEALSWTAEVYLNGKLLVISHDPFRENLLPVAKGELRAFGNSIRVNMSTQGEDFPLYPEKFLGIYRQSWILKKDTIVKKTDSPAYLTNYPKAVFVAPWEKDEAFINDAEFFSKIFEGKYMQPLAAPVAFPFRPSTEALAVVARAGIRVVSDYNGCDSLAFLNEYPVSKRNNKIYPAFWRGLDLKPTSDYGSFATMEDMSGLEEVPKDRLSLLLFILAPVFLMLTLRIFAGRQYSSLPEYLTKTKIYLELIGNNKFVKEEQRWVMSILRMLLLANLTALFLYYLQQTGSWNRLNVFQSESILFNIYAGKSYSVYVLFSHVFVVVAGLNFLKYFFLNLCGSIFRMFGMGSTIQNLDVFASFPLNLLPYIPAAAIFFVDPNTGKYLLTIWYVFFFIYYARRIILLFTGLTKLFQFSLGIKILYICTLEILPWIFLF